MHQSALALLQELENRETTDRRRLRIGERLAHLGDPRSGVALKAGLPELMWLPVTPRGEVELLRVWVPDRPDEEAQVIHRQTVPVEPFYMAKYQVTYAQYQAFIEAEDGFEQPVWWQGIPAAWQHQPLVDPSTTLGNHPRDSLSWYQCVAFARWLNQRLAGFEVPHPAGEGRLRVGQNGQIRLPTEWEWQWAAQHGAEARPYPWGEKQAGYANTAEAGLQQVIAVGMYPQGAAACGALDLAGNLMEWCANDKANLAIIDVASPASKVLRGGDWGYGLENATCTYCDDEAPGQIDRLNGFRLVLGPTLKDTL